MTKNPIPGLEEYLETAVLAARKAGLILKKYWGRLSSVKEKTASWDLVTEADQESEEAILDIIQKKYPSHTTLGEETGLTANPKSEFTWIIDPLDGTTNYTHQFPMVSISIGLLHKGEPVLGVVYNPIFEEMFKGAKGMGATLNDNKISVSKVPTLNAGLLVTGFAYDRKINKDNNYPEFCHLTHMAHGVRRLGSAALDLAFVAAGRLDGYWERGLQPWDMAAGVLLVREAGGLVTSYDLKPFDLYSGRILASNGLIHEAISAELLRVEKNPKAYMHVD